jgi:hypothetical protein
MSTTEAYLDLHRDTPVAMLDHEITDRRAWTRDTVQARDWTVSLPEAAVAELLALAETVGCHPLPVLMLSPDQFPLKACRETMGRVKAILADGIGVALVDRLPLDRMTKEQAIAAYWVLGQLIATPVAQKWDGTMVYDVTDTGREYGYGVRGSWTNVELSFHTDNSFGVAPPAYVGLLCLMPPREGGSAGSAASTPCTTRCCAGILALARVSIDPSTTTGRPSTRPATRRCRGCRAFATAAGCGRASRRCS